MKKIHNNIINIKNWLFIEFLLFNKQKKLYKKQKIQKFLLILFYF